MALAEEMDVKRILKDTSIDGASLTPYLQAAETWIEKVLGRDFDVTGSVTERFANIRQDGMLYLSDIAPTSIVITGYRRADSVTGSVLVEDASWQHLGDGKIQLLWTSLGSLPWTWERIDVAYTASGQIPAPIREAAAIAAAALYRRSSLQASGLQSERIGDYAYTVTPGGQNSTESSAIPAAARQMMRPWKKTRSRST
jgi:hypothetical protein